MRTFEASHIAIKLRITSRYLCLSILLLLHHSVFSQYQLTIIPAGKDSFNVRAIGLQTSFKNRATCSTYVNQLTASLWAKGYPAASVDSVRYDSASATVELFIGEVFQVAEIRMAAAERRELQGWGWREPPLAGRPLTVKELNGLQEDMLEQYEEHGYPFAKLLLDSIRFEGEKMQASLLVDKGPLYRIDSLRVIGGVKIAPGFLQRYLEIGRGSIYRKSRFLDVSKKLRELPYLQEQRAWDLTLLGTGSILNLYLQPKRSSQANVLVGFLPASDQLRGSKMLVTGEANINLRNALGNGETIGVNWQQIQPRSPRLNLLFQQPYLFGSPFGISSSFDLLKKDSSYLNLNFLLGMQWAFNGRQSGRVFIQTLKTNLLTVDTLLLKSSKRLPDQIDVGSVNAGIDYEINTTNYRYNPLRGNVLQIVASAGLRKLKKNNVIAKLADPGFSYASLYDSVKLNSYQFRIRLIGEHYFRLGSQSTLKAALNGALLESPSLFRNELFQIGGYRLLRGFDEESIYATAFAVGTAEYRFLIGTNSYLFSFIDAGWVQNKSGGLQQRNRFLGVGAGLAFETKAGIFNISLAAGKRDDAAFNLRQAKIHLGYATYF